jgi:hypothetical protein
MRHPPGNRLAAIIRSRRQNHQEIVYLEAFGMQDAAKGVAMPTNTMFRIAP